MKNDGTREQLAVEYLELAKHKDDLRLSRFPTDKELSELQNVTRRMAEIYNLFHSNALVGAKS